MRESSVDVRAVAVVAREGGDGGSDTTVVLAPAGKGTGTGTVGVDGAIVDPLKVRERIRMESLSLKLELRLKLGLREDDDGGANGKVGGDAEVGVLGGVDIAVVCCRSHCVTRLERDGGRDRLGVVMGMVGDNGWC